VFKQFIAVHIISEERSSHYHTVVLSDLESGMYMYMNNTILRLFVLDKEHISSAIRRHPGPCYLWN